MFALEETWVGGANQRDRKCLTPRQSCQLGRPEHKQEASSRVYGVTPSPGRVHCHTRIMYILPRYPVGWGSWSPLSRQGNSYEQELKSTWPKADHDVALGPGRILVLWTHLPTPALCASAAGAWLWELPRHLFPQPPKTSSSPSQGHCPQAPPQNEPFLAPCLCLGVSPPFCMAGTSPALTYLLISLPQEGLPKQPSWGASPNIFWSSCFFQGSYTMWEYFVSPLELFPVNKLPFKQKDG